MPMQIHCLKCKRKTPTEEEHIAMSKNNRKMMKGVCGICGTRKSQFIKMK